MKQRYTKEHFLKRVKDKGIEGFDFSKTIYINQKSPMVVTCLEHGDFTTTSIKFFASGCPVCGWVGKANDSKYFNSYKCYTLLCWSNTETFFKIGITFLGIRDRYFDERAIPYKFELYDMFVGRPEEAFWMERELHAKNKEFSYLPFLPFGGKTECFSHIYIN